MADINLFDFKGIQHGDAVVDGGDLAFDRQNVPAQPAGWQAEDDETTTLHARLDVLEIK